VSFFTSNLSTYFSSIWQTIYIVSIALSVGGLVGLVLGILLYATRAGNLLTNRPVFLVLNVLVNIVRPIPFVIFVVAVGPLMRVAIHTTIGNEAIVFALALLTPFAVARIVEQNLVAVDPGVVEAAQMAGARRLSILLTVVVPEALGPLILGYTFMFILIVDASAQAGLFGGGGLGNYAITYGSQRYNWTVTYITVATIIVIVQAGQFFGNWLARRALRR
jgi:D-methionine transport system permease protein